MSEEFAQLGNETFYSGMRVSDAEEILIHLPQFASD
jgi:hypothetical protein